jgi:hypothetical protein
MNRQLFCIKKELKNAANMLNNCTMQMQTFINQSYRRQRTKEALMAILITPATIIPQIK